MISYERGAIWTGHVKSYINPFHTSCIWIVVYHVITHVYQNIGHAQLMVTVSKDYFLNLPTYSLTFFNIKGKRNPLHNVLTQSVFNTERSDHVTTNTYNFAF